MCKTIKQKIKIDAPPLQVYRLLVDAELLHAFTGKKATNDARAGGSFTSHGGAVSGINVDLLPGKRIVQAWRARKFPKGIFSMVTLSLVPARSGGTDITLTHRGVPKDLIPEVESDWREDCWKRMKGFLKCKN